LNLWKENYFTTKKSFADQKKKVKFWATSKDIQDKPEPVLCFHTG